MTAWRSKQAMPAGRLSVTHYKALHRHLFQDVYSWAGTFHTVRIAKGDSNSVIAKPSPSSRTTIPSDPGRRGPFGSGRPKIRKSWTGNAAMPQTADVKRGFLGGWAAAGMRQLQTLAPHQTARLFNHLVGDGISRRGQRHAFLAVGNIDDMN